MCLVVLSAQQHRRQHIYCLRRSFILPREVILARAQSSVVTTTRRRYTSDTAGYREKKDTSKYFIHAFPSQTNVYGRISYENIRKTTRGAQKKKSTHNVPKLFFRPSRGGGGYDDPTPPPLRHRISYANNPHSKSYIIKGQGGYYRADTQPPGRAAAACVPATHSAEQRREGREQVRVVTMSIASTVKGPLLQPSFDKTAWLQSVCGKPADGGDFIICCCGANFGDGSGMDEGQAIEHECSAQHRETVEKHEGCSVVLERIVYLAAAAAAASTGKTKLWFIICKSAHHRTVCVVLPPPQ